MRKLFRAAIFWMLGIGNPDKIKITLAPGAKMPTRAHEDDAGLDFYALHDVTIPPGKAYTNYQVGGLVSAPQSRDRVACYTEAGSAIIDTGVAMAIPYGWYGKCTGKSGLAFKSQVNAFNGTIDAGYRGQVKFLLYNNTSEPVHIRKGEKVGQMVILMCALSRLERIDVLPEAKRGTRGFGSTGKV